MSDPNHHPQSPSSQHSVKRTRFQPPVNGRMSHYSISSGSSHSSSSRERRRENDAVDVVRPHEMAHGVSNTSIVQNESPLRRAGLLQPRSYASSNAPIPSHTAHPHSQTDIRASTMQLSNMLLSPPLDPSSPSPHANSFIFPGSTSVRDLEEDNILLPPPVSISVTSGFDDAGLSMSTASIETDATGSTAAAADLTADTERYASGAATPRPRPRDDRSRSPSQAPSGLTILLSRQGTSAPNTPTQESAPQLMRQASKSSLSVPTLTSHHLNTVMLAPSERTPLLANGDGPVLPNGNGQAVQRRNRWRLPRPTWSWKATRARIGPRSLKSIAAGTLKTGVTSLPAVLLGSLLNILDGVSYGMILFPATGIFVGLGGMGVSMFFVSAIIAQLVYTFGGSGFAGANGSMMIEVVPFFHILATSIAREIGEDKPKEVIATVLVAYALSSILTGLTFFLLGALRLGVIIGFFPRHILVGCIGGVGAFLIETGLTVSTRIDDDELGWSIFSPSSLIMWLPAMALAVLLRLITHKVHHQLVFPIYFLVIPVVFYIVVAAAGLDLAHLRTAGWLFDMGDSSEDEKWYTFYTYFDLSIVGWASIWSTLPTQFALLFFNILHPPLNVPALSVSLNEDVDTNKELVAHGYSNLLAGFFGVVPNYLVYVNTLLFYRVGGTTRIAGFLLAVATAVLLLIGTGPIAYIPVMVVGALIFVLGIDLVKEALWDTRHRVSRSEYITIVAIIVCMTVWDFVIGVLFGIVVSCFFFVVQNSQRRSIRALHTGETSMSTVRRPGAHRAYIREVSRQTTILRLQGFLFFGTITYVEETIRNIVEGALWQKNPVRFLVLDFSLVAGVDMSAAEALVRVQRLLSAKRVILVFCGFSVDSPVGKALQSVGVLDEEGVELFSTFNDAMEWTENAYLRAWFISQKSETSAVALPGRQDLDIGLYQPSIASSPRRAQMTDAGTRTFVHDNPTFSSLEGDTAEPYNTIFKTFSSYGEVNRDHFRPLVPYLERVSAPEGLVLWRQNDSPDDGLYIIESGVLRASYKFADYIPQTEESMVPGTLAGELSALSGLPRNSTVVVERQVVLWKLSIENMRRLETDHPELARSFMHFVLKAAKIDYDVLLSALATRQ